MKARWKLVLSTMVVFAGTVTAVCADTSQPLDSWTITAGQIKVVKPPSAGGAKHVRGTFKLKSKLAEPGARRAGACLLADLTEQLVGKSSCTNDDECQSDHRVVPPNAPAGSVNTSELLFAGMGHSYCISPNKNEPKRCWTRPGSDVDYCNKGQQAPGEFAVPGRDPVSGAATSVSADPLGNGKPVRWLVLGCLNPKNFVPAQPPCAVPSFSLKVTSTGPAKRVKP